MPIRIYEIAKKLGMPSKEVLERAKELKINATVPSNTLDKITAEYLIDYLQKPAPESAETPAAGQPAEQGIEIITGKREPESAPPPEPLDQGIEIITDKQEGDREAPPEPPEQGIEIIKHKQEAETVAPPEPAAPAEPVPGEVADVPEGSPAGDDLPQADETAAPPEEPDPAVAAEESSAETEAPAEAADPPAAADDELESDEEESPGLGAKIGFIKLSRNMQGRSRSDHPAGRRYENRRKSNRKSERAEANRDAERKASHPKPKYVAPVDAKPLTLKQPVIVRDLAEVLHRKPFQIIADLMELNVFATVDQTVEEFYAKQICAKYGYRFESKRREKGAGVTRQQDIVNLDVDDEESDLVSRPPVVTIMGHVDHGKTTLLDVIRKSNVVSGEAGGITQHIGAYTIHFPHPERPQQLQQITFLDTPGHAAFSAMRARGANVTDLVILVVAANDGIKPQTLEALNHAKAAHVPIIVAVNKIDLPGANPINVRQQLQDRGLVCEEWGGETIFVDISALNATGIDILLEMVLLQAEILELRANPNRAAVGNVIESGMKQGGPIATVLVRKGTLKIGDAMLCGPNWGRVKALINEDGKRLKKATPSVAVRVLGLNGAPEAGLQFNVLGTEKQARRLAESTVEASRRKSAEKRSSVTLENLFDTLSADTAKLLKVVIKADTQGSAEAIVDSLKNIDSQKVKLDIVHSGVGSINESDIMLASASKAVVIGFQTRIDTGIADIAKHESVQIKLYSIIYELIDQVREAMAGLLDPITKARVNGVAEIRKIFEISKGSRVAGCIVNQGKFERGPARVLRKGDLIFEGRTHSLRRFQDEVTEVRAGMECGIRIDRYNDFQEGDTIESFTLEEVAQKL